MIAIHLASLLLMLTTRLSLTVSLAILTIGMSASAQKKTDRQLANLRGPINEFTESYQVLTGSEPPNLIPETFYRHQLKFDVAGNILIRTLIDEDGRKNLGREKRTYGPDGRLRQSEVPLQDGSSDRVTYTYMRDGRLSESQTLTAWLRYRTTFTYDAKGRVIQETYHMEPNSGEVKTVFKYDTSGKVIEMAFFVEGKASNSMIGPCFPAHRITFAYDAGNRVATKTMFDEDNVAVHTWQYHSYDDRGNPLKTTFKTPLETTTWQYRYEFDSYGNWIKAIAAVDLSANAPAGRRSFEEFQSAKESKSYTEISERRIRYYPTK